MMSGILRCDSSFVAISNGSVSPSSGTSIGAFILYVSSVITRPSYIFNVPDLQGPGTQDPRPFVLGHIRRSDPFLIRLVLLLSSSTHLGLVDLLLQVRSRSAVMTKFSGVVSLRAIYTRLFFTERRLIISIVLVGIVIIPSKVCGGC